MVGEFQKSQVMRILVLVLTCALILAGACSTSLSTPLSTSPTPADFDYQVRVQRADTGNYIEGATVTIEIKGEAAPLDAITDSRGVARIFVPALYGGQPGFLIVEAKDYEKYTQNIDVVEGALPDVIRLEPTLAVSPSEPDDSKPPTAEAPEEPIAGTTAEPTEETTSEPTRELISEPTQEPTPQPTQEPTQEPTEKPTVESTEEPIVEPTEEPGFTDQLAIPLVLGTSPKVYIANTEGELLGYLDMARQPDYTKDGTKLIVNGDGGGLDKLRVSDSTGQNWYEIGDPGLGGHSHPAWSPDGTHIVYDDGTIDPAGWAIFTCDCEPREGEGERLEAAGGSILDPHPLYPLWTSEDRFIFRGCDTWATGVKCGIWVTKGNYGQPQQFTENPNHIPTDVDGDIVLYSSQEAGDWNIYRLNLATGKTRQLTFDPAADGLATISPDGQMVAFLSNRGGGLAVWTIGISRDTPQKLFDISTGWGTLRGDGWTEEKLSWGE